MKRKILATLATAVMVSLSAWAHAAGTTVGHVCDVEFAADKVGNAGWVILDARSGEDYAHGHIPGAVNYGEPAYKVVRHPVDGRRYSDEKLAVLFGQIGLDDGKGLIVYGNKGDYRAGIEQIPIYIGVKEFYFLDGGFDAWVREGKSVQKDLVQRIPGVFKPKVANRKFYVSTYEMMQIAKNPPKNVTVIDTRTRAEYDGVENTTIRGGRFPGAIHINYDRTLDKETGKLLPNDALLELFKGIPKGNMVILYGHKSSRTTFPYYALERLGYKNVRIYDDGWIVYGNRPDTKVENEAYQDRRGTIRQVGEIPELKERIRILEEKMQKLERP